MSASIQTELQNLHFTPGEAIRGRVSWQPDPRCKSAHLRLLWFTQGKGDRDVGIAHELELNQPTAGGERRFEFITPPSPPSFSGRLISLSWTLELTLQPSGLVHRQDITISPTGDELDLTVLLSDEEANPQHKAVRWFTGKFGNKGHTQTDT